VSVGVGRDTIALVLVLVRYDTIRWLLLAAAAKAVSPYADAISVSGESAYTRAPTGRSQQDAEAGTRR
jgi:hypothetical protein